MFKRLASLFVMVGLLTGLISSPAIASVLADGTYDCVTGLPSSDPPVQGEMPGLVIQNSVLVSSDGCTIGNQYDNTPLFTVTIPDGTTEIGPESLRFLRKVTSISIPDSVTRISERAFIDCRITSISIPVSVTYIGESAFFSCRFLTTVTFEAGSNLQTIQNDVFQQTAVSSLTLPASLEFLGYMDEQQTPLRTLIFEDNSRLRSVQSLVNAPFLTSIQFGAGSTFVNDDGVIYNAARTDLLMYPRARTGDFVIPATVTRIGERAFKDTQITQINIPATVRSIDGEAFASTDSLASVTFAPGIQLEEIQEEVFSSSGITGIIIPASVRHIRESAFYETYSLMSVLFEDGSLLETIEEGAFYYSNFSSISLPATLTLIGDEAFSSNESLCSVTFANGSVLESIGYSAFEYTCISSIAIPTTVNFIGSSALNISSLANITVLEPNASYTAIDGVLFDQQVTTLLQYPSRKTNEFYAVPSTVQTIQRFAVASNPFLTSVSIPSSIQTIETGAFAGNTSLNNFAIAQDSGITRIEDGVFYNTTSLKSITLPVSVEFVHIYAFYQSGIQRITFLGNQFTWLVYNEEDPLTLLGVSDTGVICIDPSKDWEQVYKDLYSCDHTIRFDSNGGSPISLERFNFSTTESESTVMHSAQIPEPPTPTRPGYTFAGWSISGGGSPISFPYSLSEVGDFALYAKWIANPVTEEPFNDSPAAPSTGDTTTAPVTNSSSSTITKPVVATVTNYAPKFPIGSASLAKVGQKTIKKIVKKYGIEAKYTVVGGASKRTGVPMAFVKALAKLRAERVKAQLIKLGVKESNITIKTKVTDLHVSPKTKITVS